MTRDFSRHRRFDAEGRLAIGSLCWTGLASSSGFLGAVSELFDLADVWIIFGSFFADVTVPLLWVILFLWRVSRLNGAYNVLHRFVSYVSKSFDGETT